MKVRNFVNSVVFTSIVTCLIVQAWVLPDLNNSNSDGMNSFTQHFIGPMIIPLLLCVFVFLFKDRIFRAFFLQVLLSLTMISPLIPAIHRITMLIQDSGGMSEWWLTIVISLGVSIWLFIGAFRDETKRLRASLKDPSISNGLELNNQVYDISKKTPKIDTEKDELLHALFRFVQSVVFPILPIVSRFLSQRLNEQQEIYFQLSIILVVIAASTDPYGRFIAKALEIRRLEKFYKIKLVNAVDTATNN